MEMTLVHLQIIAALLAFLVVSLWVMSKWK